MDKDRRKKSRSSWEMKPKYQKFKFGQFGPAMFYILVEEEDSILAKWSLTAPCGLKRRALTICCNV